MPLVYNFAQNLGVLNVTMISNITKKHINVYAKIDYVVVFSVYMGVKLTEVNRRLLADKLP